MSQLLLNKVVAKWGSQFSHQQAVWIQSVYDSCRDALGVVDDPDLLVRKLLNHPRLKKVMREWFLRGQPKAKAARDDRVMAGKLAGHLHFPYKSASRKAKTIRINHRGTVKRGRAVSHGWVHIQQILGDVGLQQQIMGRLAVNKKTHADIYTQMSQIFAAKARCARRKKSCQAGTCGHP